MSRVAMRSGAAALTIFSPFLSARASCDASPAVPDAPPKFPTRKGAETPLKTNPLDLRPRYYARDILTNGCLAWAEAGLEQTHSCDYMRQRLEAAVILAGSSNPALSEEIGYETSLGLSHIDVSRFSDGEVNVRIGAEVLGKDVFIVQSAAPPINDSLFETLLIVAAARRSGARTVTVVAPSLPYSQDTGLATAFGHLIRHGVIEPPRGTSGDAQREETAADGVIGEGDDDAGADYVGSRKRAADRTRAEANNVISIAESIEAREQEGRFKPAEVASDVAAPLSAADVARLLVEAGVDRVISVDVAPPGTGQFEGFFPPAVSIESLRSARIFVEQLARLKLDRPIVVAPNEECIQLAADVRHGLQLRTRGTDEDVGIAVIVETGASGRDRFTMHRRKGGVLSTSRGSGDKKLALQLLGDVQGRDVIITDHLIDTGKTLVDRALLLKANGARRVVAMATHAIFSGQALQRINKSPLTDVVVSNTIPLRDDVTFLHSHKIATVSIAPLLAAAILRTQTDLSLHSLRTVAGERSENDRLPSIEKR